VGLKLTGFGEIKKKREVFVEFRVSDTFSPLSLLPATSHQPPAFRWNHILPINPIIPLPFNPSKKPTKMIRTNPTINLNIPLPFNPSKKTTKMIRTNPTKMNRCLKSVPIPISTTPECTVFVYCPINLRFATAQKTILPTVLANGMK
jgi:hypothetical protein